MDTPTLPPHWAVTIHGQDEPIRCRSIEHHIESHTLNTIGGDSWGWNDFLVELRGILSGAQRSGLILRPDKVRSIRPQRDSRPNAEPAPFKVLHLPEEDAGAKRCAHARTDVPRLVAGYQAVLEVHQRSPNQRAYGFPRADHWEHYCLEDERSWPCPTIQALTDKLTGEDDE